jgi:hypothetical protein
MRWTGNDFDPAPKMSTDDRIVWIHVAALGKVGVDLHIRRVSIQEILSGGDDVSFVQPIRSSYCLPTNEAGLVVVVVLSFLMSSVPLVTGNERFDQMKENLDPS